jgi:NTP pyrophosphatase (non-canonical NTP hydrolase)
VFVPAEPFLEEQRMSDHIAERAEQNQTLTIEALQQLIRQMYLRKDVARGVEGTFMWFMEEVGELAAALRGGSHEERVAEFADVLAWLVTMANVVGVDLTEAIRQKYGNGCPGCGNLVCTCDDQGKP